ncbi:TlpA family protein disulfide reductase [Nucisporomicrobium flavum]|jgi:cytochrome c biogenesis protein CcmG, thiol:disulfide interchange protein DsbE|uniref:TlpA family protein disulfide reductase n=1 Tax=Nucisporomicrobium flavum TaxID=2785915 RepID=UPI0018F56EC8|nr:TlpA disulfide reductase family protein [Nucisporomicrobium flavum]
MSRDLASRPAPRPALARWLTPPLVLLLAACTATEVTPGPDESPAPFADCASLTASSSEPASGGVPDLPDLSLPCFTGGAPVRLAALRGPAVINLWGSWCAPCREELPLIQELADATAGRLRVIGVDTRDDRDAGASFASDHGVTMPTLYDRDQKLLTALEKLQLPVTVFLRGDGKRFVYTGEALDKPTLGTLVRDHTGVTVAG